MRVPLACLHLATWLQDTRSIDHVSAVSQVSGINLIQLAQNESHIFNGTRTPNAPSLSHLAAPSQSILESHGSKTSAGGQSEQLFAGSQSAWTPPIQDTNRRRPDSNAVLLLVLCIAGSLGCLLILMFRGMPDVVEEIRRERRNRRILPEGTVIAVSPDGWPMPSALGNGSMARNLRAWSEARMARIDIDESGEMLAIRTVAVGV